MTRPDFDLLETLKNVLQTVESEAGELIQVPWETYLIRQGRVYTANTFKTNPTAGRYPFSITNPPDSGVGIEVQNLYYSVDSNTHFRAVRNPTEDAAGSELPNFNVNGYKTDSNIATITEGGSYSFTEDEVVRRGSTGSGEGAFKAQESLNEGSVGIIPPGSTTVGEIELLSDDSLLTVSAEWIEIPEEDLP